MHGHVMLPVSCAATGVVSTLPMLANRVFVTGMLRPFVAQTQTATTARASLTTSAIVQLAKAQEKPKPKAKRATKSSGKAPARETKAKKDKPWEARDAKGNLRTYHF